jgi:LmbE family N-acetylglucosaminyl deacetylase
LLRKVIKSIRCAVRRQFIIWKLRPCNVSVLPSLVIAPHPDDETLGVGGLIALRRQENSAVRVIFLTSGEASHMSCCSISREEVACIRRQQALEATACLGLNSGEILWQDLQDGRIPCKGEKGFEDSVTILAEILKNEKPAEVYCPHPYDGWRDHEATSAIVNEALERSGHDVKLIYYLVWSWYNAPSMRSKFFNWNKAWKLNIERVFEKKISAIRHYLEGPKAPCGYPFCGRLPRAVISCAKKRTEIFIDGENPNR